VRDPDAPEPPVFLQAASSGAGIVIAAPPRPSRAVQEHGRWVQIQTAMLFDRPPNPDKWNFIQNQIAVQSAK
jgi:hypothetical protein